MPILNTERESIDAAAHDRPTILVNEERTVLVTIWDGGPTTVATREDSSHIWGPPTTVEKEG